MNNNQSELSTITKQTMSSLEIAKLTGKEHNHVMRDIRNILDEAEIGASKFGGTYLDKSNRQSPCFNLPYRETQLVISGYSVPHRLAIIDRWQKLESKAVVPAMPTYSEALRLYADSLDKLQEKDKYIVATNQAQIAAGEILVREFVKANDIIELGEKGFYSWMREQGIILKGSNEPYEKYKKLGYFHWKPTEEMHGGKFRYTLTITPRGKVWLAARYMAWMDEQL